jgi:hypothetical protein
MLHTCFCVSHNQIYKDVGENNTNHFSRTAKLLQTELPFKKFIDLFNSSILFPTQIENIGKTRINQLKPNNHGTYADSKHL